MATDVIVVRQAQNNAIPARLIHTVCAQNNPFRYLWNGCVVPTHVHHIDMRVIPVAI